MGDTDLYKLQRGFGRANEEGTPPIHLHPGDQPESLVCFLWRHVNSPSAWNTGVPFCKSFRLDGCSVCAEHKVSMVRSETEVSCYVRLGLVWHFILVAVDILLHATVS